MKVFLLHRDQDFDPAPELRDEIFDAMASGNLWALSNVRRNQERQQNLRAVPRATAQHDELAQDLELETLWRVMAAGDDFLFETAKRVVLSSLRAPEAIVYRQRVLADCIEHAATVRELYELSIQALAYERDVGSLWTGAGPDLILHRSVRLLRLHVEALRRLRRIADEQLEDFSSEGFRRLFATLREELADRYLETVERHLRDLEFKRGVLESAELGKGDRGERYIVHEPPREQRWRERLAQVGGRRAQEYRFELNPRDEAGARALAEIRGKGINQIADAVARSADHVQSFFPMLRLELAFYLGCLNLRAWLDQKGEPTCYPEPVAGGQLSLTAEGIYDVCLTLHLEDRVVGNDVDADGKSLVMITGANQGGKSTLLRALGLAQLMMQSGTFVGAESFRASICSGVFTRYKREEDTAMEGGKLAEELRRMSELVDQIRPHAVLLCNESFASTNEREGSEIGRQVVRALLDKRIRVYFVTHLYDLADSFHARRLDSALFVRAEREPDGRRTFKLLEGEPLPTSYGEDSYRRIFGHAQSAEAAVESRP
jgi:DNA mismatch repair ATPase MutS